MAVDTEEEQLGKLHGLHEVATAHIWDPKATDLGHCAQGLIQFKWVKSRWEVEMSLCRLHGGPVRVKSLKTRNRMMTNAELASRHLGVLCGFPNEDALDVMLEENESDQRARCSFPLDWQWRIKFNVLSTAMDRCEQMLMTRQTIVC